MSNIFRSELIRTYNTKNRTSGIGEYKLRNDTWAMDIQPEPFYKNISDSISGILLNEFIPNTSYIIDMWIDADAVVYNSNNVAAGFTVRYTDNSTNDTFVVTGGNKGFQHKKLITPPDKTIARLEIYYYTSMPVYYRWDSYICPVDTLNVTKTGQFKVTNIIENQNQVSFSKGGSAYGGHLYEY